MEDDKLKQQVLNNFKDRMKEIHIKELQIQIKALEDLKHHEGVYEEKGILRQIEFKYEVDRYEQSTERRALLVHH